MSKPERAPAAPTIERKALIAALTACVRATDELVLLGDGFVAGVGSTMSVVVPLPGSVAGVAVHGRSLLERVKRMPDGPIVLTAVDTSLAVTAPGSARRFRLPSAPGADYPAVPQVPEGAAMSALPTAVLAELIARTSPAISPDVSRPHLNAALFEWEGETARMVTTDGHRLCLRECATPGQAGSVTALLAARTIAAMSALIADGSESVELIPDAGALFLRTPAQTLWTALVDSEFPPYRQVIPESSAHQVVAPRAALMDAIRAVAVAARKDHGGVRCEFKPGALRLIGESPEGGDARDELAVDGEAKVTMGLAARYILDALEAVEGESVKLGISGELDPVVVTGDGGALTVVMPMRV